MVALYVQETSLQTSATFKLSLSGKFAVADACADKVNKQLYAKSCSFPILLL